MPQNRRSFLKGACALLAMGGHAASAASPGPLVGVFPIGWTPCTPDNRLDAAAMVRQMEFINRGKVAGLAWPQNASGWSTLTAREWNAGAEALASVGGRSALVLGVQTPGFDLAGSRDYARTARRLNAHAIISIVPPDRSDADVIAYFRALADASGLPVMVQAVGDTSVDTLVALAAAVPAIVAFKDEAGDPLARAPDLLRRTGGRVQDFSGGGGMKFFPEMELGFTGTCPYVGLSDVLQASFNAYRAGRKREAFDIFGHFLAFNTLPHANDYVLKARGVFAEDAIMRVAPGGRPRGSSITDAGRRVIRDALATYLKPYLVA
jgi:4-hydroxy-tetrahydrodipicolinate synthase